MIRRSRRVLVGLAIGLALSGAFAAALTALVCSMTEGPLGPVCRIVVFSDSRVDELSPLSPAGGFEYFHRLQEGTAAETWTVCYPTSASPAAALAHYQAECEALGFAATEDASDGDPLSCQRAGDRKISFRTLENSGVEGGCRVCIEETNPWPRPTP